MRVDKKQRRLIIRLALVAVWIGLGVLLFVVNRGHTILVDNKDVENPGLRAPGLITVTVNREKPMEFLRGDRDMVKVTGSRQRITVEYSDGTPPFHGVFSLPIGPDMFLLSIPKMINGVEPFFEVFHTQQESRSADTTTEPGSTDTPTEVTPAAP